MDRFSLNGEWKLKVLGENVYDIPQSYVSSTVPGTVYGTYVDNGMMPDPYYRENELEAVKLADNDFEYVKIFNIDKEQLSYDKLLLVFEGIDTIGSIYLNNQLLGKTCNMHIRHEYDVLELVKTGENTLRVVLQSPVKYIREENKKVYTGGSQECMEGYPHLRKAHCMFGWDWGPRLPDAGIFRPVYLLGINKMRIKEVYVTQEHSENKVVLDFDIQLEDADILKDKQRANVLVTVTGPDGGIFKQETDGSVKIANPAIWWPNGYGAQPLYTVRVELFDHTLTASVENGKEPILFDTWERRIGLRTMEVNIEQDQWGNQFSHRVNGLDIFAMGADYIPEDNLLGRVNKQRTEKLLKDCIAANHNSIRVWGGGYYLDDYFYDICDELGLLVWQDFMFACSSYELDDAFEENIREEVTQNVRRLRHHASLALWCGNNEMETQTLDQSWKPSEKQKYDYIKIFEYIIPRIVKKEDPQTFYWPSSPSSGGNFDNPWDENRGDAHYWDVWHGSKPYTEYRKYRFRYLSEFGFQSFSCLKTVESFTEPSDRNIFSRVMEMHQRNRAANGKILDYLAKTYLYPKDFDSLLYTSQLLQAEAIRYGVEHFRRYRGQCMGAVVWQLNDIWPVASWSSIDYFGRWKALHYAECKMFSPILLSCEEEGELSERPFCVQERIEPIEISAKLHVANETWDTVEGIVYWALRRPDASIIKEGHEKVVVKPFSGEWLDKLDFSEYDECGCYISYCLKIDEKEISAGTTMFTPPKHFKFENPLLTWKAEDHEIRIKASSYAKSVEIIALDGDARFSDNYFDMNAGEVCVQIVSGEAKKFSVRSVFDIA